MRAVSEHAGEVRWMSRKSQELFAYLLMYRGNSVSKGQILTDIFPERSFGHLSSVTDSQSCTTLEI